MKTLVTLFAELFRISLFVIGGGYSILMVADRRFAKLGWIREGELLDHLPVFQTVPGLIATHTAVYIGRKRAGRLGALTAVVAVAIPAVAIFTGVSVFYRLIPLGNPWLDSAFIGLRAALTGIIAATVIGSWRKSLPDAFAYALAVAALLAIGWFRVHVALVLVLAMLLGLSVTLSSAASTSAPRFGFSFVPLLLFAQYGALCFGGGFVLVPMYLHDFVGETAPYLQIAVGEFGDIMAVSQLTPGPVGVNCATFFGYRLAGAAGALIASALLLLPGSVLAYAALSSLERFRTSPVVNGIMRGIRPASIALMLFALFAFAKMTVCVDGEFRCWGALLIIAATAATVSRRINVIALIVLCAVFGSAVRAGTAEEVTAAVYPDADTVTVDSREDVEYFPDGTWRSVEESWTKALTEKGRRELGTDRIDFNRRYGDARFAEVAIIAPDGKRTVPDLGGLVREATDNSSAVANIYDPLDRRIVCTIPGVRVGDVVYVRKERKVTSARCRDQWSTLSVFEDFAPVVRASLRVRCPKERPIRRAALRHPLGNVTESAVTNADGSVTLEWCATNSPQAFWEPSMPAPYLALQHVVISTAADWRELSRWYWELCAPHLAKTNAAMVAKVKELADGAAGDRGRLLKEVFRFVSQEIRYMGLTMEDASPGFAPHDVDITFDNRYGVCRDKAGLLVAMLRLAGFRAYPVMISAGSAKMDADVPSPYFNHAIVAVESADAPDAPAFGRYVLMDPTNENAKDLFPAYLCDCSYLVACPEGEDLMTSPVPPPEDNALDIEATATLSRDGSMFYEAAIGMRGVNDTVYRGTLVRRTPEERERTFERILRRAVPGAELVKCVIEPRDLRDTSAPMSVRLAARFPETVVRGETRDELIVPSISPQMGLANWLLEGDTALERRRFPLKLDTTACVRERLTVGLGGALGEVLELPDGERTSNGYDYTRAFAVTNGTLTMERSLAVSSVEFRPDAYLDLREEIKRVEAAERRRPVFACDRLHDANVRRVLDSSETTLFSDTSWVTTNVDVTEVLTYKGKKDSAELEFDYHPSWMRIDLVSATVSNRDGRVYSVSPKEVNEMDCGWAASAPRYPAGKIRVVNLPSVEIGSVISVKTVVTVTNAPAPFYACVYFDSRQPVDRLVRRIDGFRHDSCKVKRLPDEPNQPDGRFWRDYRIFTRGNWEIAAERLGKAVEVSATDPDDALGRRHPSSDPFAFDKVKPDLRGVRDWMAKYVKIAGPSLYELPLELQLTAPETVLRERYATRLDYVRTMCSLLRGAGYAADVVFAADDAAAPEEVRRSDRIGQPNVGAFALALCRVRVREGGFLWFGGETKEYFIGTENEYTPVGATAYEGSDYFDPASGEFGIVANSAAEFATRDDERFEIDIRENGAVDIAVRNRSYGSRVGLFRKRFEEMLPELRERFHQTLLGEISQAASATGELVTDTKGYPAETRFECFVPDYARVCGDAVSVTLPPFDETLPALTGTVRGTPVAVAAEDPKTETLVVRFPEGYTEAERLPEPFVIRDPFDPSRTWCRTEVASAVRDGRLEVTVAKETFGRGPAVLAREYFPLFRDWTRRDTAPSARTVTARRGTRR